MAIKKDAVLAALRAEDVATHLGIKGAWRGLWLRSSRCGEADHSTDAFGLKRDGHWHCWACDRGGDLLALVAAGAGISLASDFPGVLKAAAEIAGIDDDDSWGAPPKPPPIARPPLPPEVPVSDRIKLARKRALWVWERLREDERAVGLYLRTRGLDAQRVMPFESIRTTPMRMERPGADAKPELVSLWRTMTPLAMVVPVRSVEDGAYVDLRARRYEPLEGQPKIVGMLGGITSAPAEAGRARQLVGCYGSPHQVDADLIVVVEGLMDYLTAMQVWPNAQILGAVEAGSMALVAGHAARALAKRDDTSRLLIVEQNDPPRTRRDGTVVAGAADAAINEDPNSATKVAVRHLGPKRVGWLFCSAEAARIDAPIKDLNDLVAAQANVSGMLSWWQDLASEG